MRGPVRHRHLGVIFGALIFISHQHRNRCAAGHSIHHTRENFASICFFPWCGDDALARPPSIQFLLKILFVQRQPGWTSIDDTPDPFSMRFSKGGDAKRRSKRVGVSRRHRHLVGSVQTGLVSLSWRTQVYGSRRLMFARFFRSFARSFVGLVVDPPTFLPFRSFGRAIRRFVSPRRLLALRLLSFVSTLPFHSHRLVRTCMMCMAWYAAAIRSFAGSSTRS
mmetsp:Transcript_9504/g.57980  ORF Transcript_9504/g.57980 Transcript_9504/m.57980 type:complete len:222 (+) Transcript_9504:1224-1889(+)